MPFASFYHADYEFWIVVNHPLFTDTRLWEPVEAFIAREVARRCAVSLSVYSKQDIRTARATRDTYILDRLEAGIAQAYGPFAIRGWRSRQRPQRAPDDARSSQCLA